MVAAWGQLWMLSNDIVITKLCSAKKEAAEDFRAQKMFS